MLYVPTLLQAIDLIGTFVFALSGAVAGVRRGLDLFGVLVVAFVAAVFGGITRDIVIGAVPPDALRHPHYMVLAATAGLLTFRWYPLVARFTYPVRLFDAAGLALFAVAGTEKALHHGLDGLAAAVVGMVTAIGGGVVRDVLLAQVPVVLRADIYAVAALAGALIVVAGDRLALPEAPVAILGAAVCFALRVLALYRGWQLPASRWYAKGGS
ncbi:membrane protein [Aliidongia dinghuensis]|uniref:Membrane protein n=1 Tax=Aliidongia dinghuensis TaxID=1867774 RepID=A0A8J2YWB8_9PROT|nr:trimeric intracellular cation channel family protein [Aliidongia dinghuensis]GGF28085.1 membrane protein [Aliidongia dinghuensis]